jgi:hypothetical protein
MCKHPFNNVAYYYVVVLSGVYIVNNDLQMIETKNNYLSSEHTINFFNNMNCNAETFGKYNHISVIKNRLIFILKIYVYLIRLALLRESYSVIDTRL